MEFQKSLIIGVEFKDPRPSSTSQHMHAEVVLIDKSHKTIQPLLYQLRKDSSSAHEMTDIKQHLTTVQRDAFMMIGEVLTIDKKKKMVFLSNNNIVSYNYLIIASGTKQSIEEFNVALQTLIDALKIQKEIPLFILGSTTKAKENLSSSSLRQNPVGKNLVGHFAIPSIPTNKTLNSLHYYIPQVEKRFYEVQI